MRTSIVWLLLAVAFGAVSCSSEDSPTSPTGPIAASLEGTWRATKAEFTSVAAPTRRVDVVAQGTVVTLVLVAGGTYTFTMAEPGLPPDVTTGTWSASADVLSLRRTGANFAIEFDKTLNGNTLTLAGGSVLFDFTDGNFEEAKLTMILARQ